MVRDGGVVRDGCGVVCGILFSGNFWSSDVSVWRIVGTDMALWIPS